jgi:ribonucleotide reductase alpha subunit
MFVKKRNGKIEQVHFDKITQRIKKLVHENDKKFIDPIIVAQKVVASIFPGITTEELDLESAKIAINLCTTHHLYASLAGKILVSNLHKKTLDTFVEKEELIQQELNLLDENWFDWIKTNRNELNSIVNYNNDYIYDYFGFKTLERSYLIKKENEIIERPQDMLMRVASFINQGDLEMTKKTYELMAKGYYTHASPTLFNAGNKRSQLSSCFEGNTLVNTLRGPIPIKDVEINDEVITHLGNVKKVIQKHKNKINERKLYEVNIRKTNKFIVTEDHKLFCYNIITKESDWKEVKLLDKNDYIMIPKYNGTILKPEINILEIIKTYDFSKYKDEIKVEQLEDKKQVYITTIFKHSNLNNQCEVLCCTKSTPLNSKIEINEDIIKFIGIWFRYGHIMTQVKNDIKIIGGIGITIHDKNIELINFCKEIKKYFGIEHVIIHKTNKQNIIQVLYNYPILGIVFNQLFDKEFNGKQIPETFYKYDTKLILSFLTGLITTHGRTINLYMANKNLINQIYSLCRLHNLDVGQVCSVKPRKLTKTQTYNISLTNLRYELSDIWKICDDRINKLKKKSFSIIDDNNFKYLHFEGRTEVNIDDEYVYTLGIEDDHSYSIEGIIAQNCFLLGTDDSLDGITKTWADVSKISKWGGGIGLHVSNIRAKDSLIRGTNGPSSGIIPMLKVYNEIARYIDQCFVGSTRIFTEKGLNKIENIVPKDKVYTIDGTLQEVERVYCDKYVGKVVKIKLNGCNNIVKVTEEHPFLVVKSNKKIPFDLLKNKLSRQLVIPDWVSVNEIKENDFVCIPIPTYVNDNVNLDESDCYIYGLMINDYYVKDNMLGKPIEIHNRYIKEYLEFNRIEYIIENNYIMWNITSKFKFTLNQIINLDYNLLNLPINKLKYILKGILDANNKIINEQYIIIDQFVNLANSYYDFVEIILLKLGILILNDILYDKPKILISKNKIISELYDTNESIESYYLIHNNNIYINIDKIEYEMIDSIVYDLEIKNNHNYLTEVGLVHNGGKRKGSIAIYLEPHHADIMAFLDLRKNFGAETERARDLFLAVWVSDLFMKQVEADGDWYLMCPDKCSGLSDVYGERYEELYWSYVEQNKFNKKVKARDIMKAILDSQLETGTPYIGFKDNINNKSNQKNIGVIKSSNLCIEIVEYSDANEYAVCNLASIAINKCVDEFVFNKEDKWTIYTKENCKYCIWAKTFLSNKGIKFIEIKNKLPQIKDVNTYPQIFHGDNNIGGFDKLYEYTKGIFNYDKLYDIAYIATVNLNKVIDINYYPVIEAKRSNLKHRPIGLGIQGLADALVLMKIPFDSDESVEFNSKMMETIYLAAVTASIDESKDRYDILKDYINEIEIDKLPEYYDSTYYIENKNINDVYHKLKLNKFELGNKTYGAYSTFEGSPISEGKFQFDLWSLDRSKLKYYDKWNQLTEKVKQYGIRNSLLTALMPTASTSQILGNNECFEFFTNNIYSRRTLAGDFPLVNKYLIDDLYNLGLWSNDMKQLILANNGSISNFNNIPDQIKALYKTIWEIKQLWVLKNAIARGPFNDQTQSMNIFMQVPDYQKLYSSHFYSWKNGLKTGIYYLRTKPSKEAVKVTIDPNIHKKLEEITTNNDTCDFCSA